MLAPSSVLSQDPTRHFDAICASSGNAIFRRMYFNRVATFLISIAAFGSAQAVSLDDLKDPEDGRFDTSRFLLDLKGFLPVPIIVTEPAVGYGGGAALVFFQRNEPTADRPGKSTPPDITAIAGMATENGTRGGGVGHLGFSRDGNWRYSAGAGKASVNVAFYGDALLPGASGSQATDVNLEAKAAVVDVRRRVMGSDWFAGLRYLRADVASRLRRDDDAQVPPRDADTTLASLAVIVEYDGRDNIFTPSSGSRLTFRGYDFGEAWGGEREFRRYEAAFNTFGSPVPRLVLGGRADYKAVTGDAPFYTQPFIQLRGVPAMRYQGDRTAVLEAEGRYDLDGRWSVVAFAGGGRAWRDGEGIGGTPTRWAGGLGFRYLVARLLGLHAGLDVARGPEDTAVYITVGSYWR